MVYTRCDGLDELDTMVRTKREEGREGEKEEGQGRT
jgi:hypothetical protein